MKREAVIKGEYRYSLVREWDEGKGRCCFIMLNPSTADGEVDDATIRRCIGFAKGFNCGSIEVVNLFPYRTTDRKELIRKHQERDMKYIANKQRNLEYVKNALDGASLVICAWGRLEKKWMERRAEKVVELISDDDITSQYTFCLGETKDGFPKQPVRLKGDTPLHEFRWANCE